MKPCNFPGKLAARRQKALENLKGPDAAKFPDKETFHMAMNRFETNRNNLVSAIKSVFGDPTRIRTKKDRSDRAKIR